MSFFSWAEKQVRQMKWYDIGIFKLCVFAFAMMLANLLPQLPALGWQIWGMVFALTYFWLLRLIGLRRTQ